MGSERKFPRAYFNGHMAGHDVIAVSGEAQNQFPSVLQSQLIILHQKVLSSFTAQGLTSKENCTHARDKFHAVSLRVLPGTIFDEAEMPFAATPNKWVHEEGRCTHDE